MITLEDDELCLRLSSRKNRDSGSIMRRSCWCLSCEKTCPDHALWPFFAELEVGAQPFIGFRPGFALNALREMLRLSNVPNASIYRTHDLRRGHCQDMVDNGSTVAEILRAGQWRSAAFLNYVDLDELERGAVMEAHMDESSSDDGE